VYAIVPDIEGDFKIKIGDSEACEAQSISDFIVISASGACGSSWTIASDLIISEVFDATSGDGSYIEVFNGTASAIDLSSPQYTIKVVNNGSVTTSLDLSGTLNSGDVYLLRTGNSSAPCVVTPTYYNGNNQLTFNGDDEVFLYKTGAIIDYVPNPDNGVGFSQIRKPSVTSPTTVYDASEWIITSTEECDDLGLGPYEAGTDVEITINPVNHSACSIEFSVTANVDPGTITYQWKYHNGFDAAIWANVEETAFPALTIVGENSADLLMTGYLEPYNGYQFYCEVSSSVGTCIKVSNAGRFTIENKPVFRTPSSISGNWTDVANWEMALTDAEPWEAACVYPKAQNSTEIIIQPGTNVVLDTDIDADKLIVGGTLEISTNTKLTILNGNAGADLILAGTLLYRANSSNSIVFEDNSGTAKDASWIFEEGASFTTTNTGSTARFRDFYEGGMSNIPILGSWTYLYNGDGIVPTTSVNMYYPDLYFDNSTASPHSWNTFSSALTGGIGGNSIVKGNLKIGTNSSASCSVCNNNIHSSPMLVYGNLILDENSVFTNQSFDGTTTASYGNGTGVEVKGNLMINGSLDFSFGNGIITLSGSALQTISSTELGTIKSYNVSLNNSSNVTLQDINLQITNILTFVNGKIITNIATSDKVIVENSSTTAIVGANSNGNDKYVQGKLQWKLLSGLAYSFPIGYDIYGVQGFAITPDGSDNSYVLAYLEPQNTNSILPVAYCDLEIGNNGIGNGEAGYDGISEKVLFDLSSPLQWNITNPGAGINTYDLVVMPNGTQDITPVTSANGLQVKYLMRNGIPGNSNIAQGNGGHPGQTNGFIMCPNGYSLIGMDGFSKFALYGATKDNTLPVELISFEAICHDPDIEILWSTASETNSSHFVVEYSLDAVNWNYLGSVRAAGNSNSLLNYKFSSNQKEAAYFRLIQVDFEGKEAIYGPILNPCKDRSKLLTKVYPNPFNQEINLIIDDAQNEFFVIEIIDMNGRILERKEFSNQSHVVLSTHDFSEGVYSL
ncbi:MAG: lamin tail domain-containing protein, partial [Bacteroidales bacterium]|nr:lamin tail domain-containing protein [Bacteroidales bacterium]